MPTTNSLKFTKRPGLKKGKDDAVMDAEWGGIEVRRDVKEREAER